MNIADGIINLIIIFYQNTILKWLPHSLPGISIENFNAGLNYLNQFIITPLYIIDKFLPISELFIIGSALLGLELVLWFVRFGLTGWNMIRGSGAKI